MIGTPARMLALWTIVSCVLLVCEARIELLNSKYMGKVAHNVKASGVMPMRTVVGRDNDSDTYYVKLPPSQHYYSALSSKVPFSPNGAAHVRRLLPVNFASNGRPARVYHWNIPVIKHMELEKNQLQRRRSNYEQLHAQQRTAGHELHHHAKTVQVKRYRKKATPENSPIHRISGVGNKRMKL